MNVLDLLLIILVVYVPNQLHFPTDLGLKGMNVLNILLALTLLAMVATGARAPAPAPVRWRIGFFAFLLTVAFMLGQLRAPGDISQDLTLLKSVLVSMLLYFIFYSSARDPGRTKRLVAVIVFVAFVASVEAVREGLDYGLGSFRESRRAAGPFGQDYLSSNRAGVFYAMFLPMFLSLLLLRRRPLWTRIAGLVGAASTIFAIFVTYSRQSYFIAAVAVIIMGLRRHIVIGLLLIGVVASWSLWAPQAAVERVDMTYVSGDSGEEKLESSAESRMLIWQGARQMILEHPLGVGFNRFHDEIGSYSENMAGKDAHNSYVLLAAEAGLPGFVAFVLVLIGLLQIGVRLVRIARDEETRALAYGYTVSVVCMMLGNVYGSAFMSGEVMGNFWALAGLVAASCNFEPAADGATTGSQD